MSKQDKALKYFRNKFNCSQSVLTVFGSVFGISEEDCLKIACASGGGMGRQQHTCGAVPLVSHHLRVLKENGILDTKRNGPFIFYYIRDKKILDAINLFLELFKNSDIKYKANSRFCSGWIITNYDNKT